MIGFSPIRFVRVGSVLLITMVGLFSTISATARSVVAYVGILLYVLIAGPPGMLLAVIFDWPEVLYCLGRWGVRFGLASVGITYHVEGLEHIQHERATVYCVNHSSNIEPPVLYMALSSLHPRLKVLYKAEIHKLPVLSHAFDIAGFVPIERKDKDRSMAAIDTAVHSLARGNSFLVFPEGTRSRTGELQRFKKGGFIMAIRGKAAVVPVAIQGTRAAMKKGSPIIRPVKISIRLGPPVEIPCVELSKRDELIAKTRSAVQELLALGPVPGATQ